jgi:hypothetical protein
MNMESITTTLTPVAEEQLLSILDVWQIHTKAAVRRINLELAKHKLPEAFQQLEIEHFDSHHHQFLGYAPLLSIDDKSSSLDQKGGDDWQLVLEVVERDDEDESEEFCARDECHGKVVGYASLHQCIPDLAASALKQLPYLLNQLCGGSGVATRARLSPPLKDVERIASLPDSNEIRAALAAMG